MAKARYRILTWRMVVAALLVGVVLAVVSVPVAAVIVDLHARSGPKRTLALHRVQDGHFIVILCDVGPTGTIWDTSAEPEPALSLRRAAELISTKASKDDPRPQIIRLEPDDTWTDATLYRVGWPLESAYCVSLRSQGTNVVSDRGFVIVQAFGRRWVIPRLPLWPGLLANILFYTTLALTPVVLLRWRRTRRRIKHGLCVACGYELGRDVEVCPECGLAEPIAFRIL
ncbi:MAG: hypothetical protein ACFCBV_00460 [Phycisphaerales bacterium]